MVEHSPQILASEAKPTITIVTGKSTPMSERLRSGKSVCLSVCPSDYLVYTCVRNCLSDCQNGRLRGGGGWHLPTCLSASPARLSE